MTASLEWNLLLDAAVAGAVVEASQVAAWRTLELHDQSTIRRYLHSGRLGDLSDRLLALLPNEEVPSFGLYRPVALLGEGGMGTAWLCLDPGRRPVVVKVALAMDQQAERRLQREIAITLRLDHPHLVRALQSGHTAEGRLWLALEYIPGPNLVTELWRVGPLRPVRALHLLLGIARAIAAIHEHGIIHRDLKPGNVILDASGEPHLVDFGLARDLGTVTRTPLTRSGVVVGTVDYMAPEQLTGDEVDHRADFYGVGCIFHQCLTGDPPFLGSSEDVMRQQVKSPPPPPPEGLPPTGQVVHRRCLEKHPECRYPTARALIDDIVKALKEAEVVASATAETSAFHARIELKGQEEIRATWLALLPLEGDDDDAAVHLYARPRIILGKLARDPVDLPALVYPTARFSEACDSISRQHVAIFRQGTGFAVQDLGSANGTRFDGSLLMPDLPVIVPSRRVVEMHLAESLPLLLRLVPARPDTEDLVCMAAACEALVIERIGNRTGLSYAMVVRRIRIGGGQVDLRVPGAGAPGPQFTWQDGRWLVEGDGWRPVTDGMVIDCGGRLLHARAGTHRMLV